MRELRNSDRTSLGRALVATGLALALPEGRAILSRRCVMTRPRSTSRPIRDSTFPSPCAASVEMPDSRRNSLCCGGGGGFLQNGMPEARRAFGKLKADQILATGASYCITPCHNCHSGIEDIIGHYKLGVHAKFISEILVEIMER